MKTKLEMAHEWVMKFGVTKTIGDREDTIKYAWEYADAMQAEADKRITEIIIDDVSKIHADALREACKKEWQPDWSQAPDNATAWTMRPDGKCIWWNGIPVSDGTRFTDVVGGCHTVGYAPSLGYTGDWRNSLRKRPK